MINLAHNSKAIKVDANDKPIPQYFNDSITEYEVITSENGILRFVLIDENGQSINFQEIIDGIGSKIDELIGVIE